MKLKTFILTFLMMSCSFLFGQSQILNVNSESSLRAYLALPDFNDCVLKVTADFTISETVEFPAGKTFTIDLNGHTLSTASNVYIFNNMGTLTIKDTNGGGAVLSRGIYNGETTGIGQAPVPSAVLNIQSGTFKNIASNGGAAVYNFGTAIITGGKFYGEYGGVTNRSEMMISNAFIQSFKVDDQGGAVINAGQLTIGENVEIIGRYSDLGGTVTGEATYYYAEMNGVRYTSLQAAIDACTTGNNTITLLFNISEDAIVKQTENVNITIDGDNKRFNYSGTIYVEGNSRFNEAETLTIQNVNFTTNEAKHDFISSNSTESDKRYAHNVTVKDCNFTSTYAGADNEVVAMRFRQSYNIKVEGGNFTNLHSVMWATGAGGNGITVENIVAENCKNGVSFGTSSPVAVKNATIDAEIYAVRADGSGAYNLTIEGGSLNAAQPVIVRNTTGEYNLTVAEDVTLTATNGGPQVVVTKDNDDVPYVAPTVKVNVTLNNDASTFGLVAKIGNKYYSKLDEAFAVATEDQTIVLLADATPTLISQRAITKAAVIDLGGKTLTLTEDDLYFGTTEFKNGKIIVDPSLYASTAIFWMFENQTLTFDNVNITATGVTGTYLIGINGGTGSNVNLLNGTNIIINNASQAALSAVICDNGTGNNVIIEDSYINVNNIEGRFYLGGTSGNITVDNTNIDLDGVKEGFYLRANQTLSIEGESEVEVLLNDTNNRYGINITDYSATYTKDDSATVNATVYDPVVRVKNLTELQTALVENVDKPIFATKTIVISEGTLELDLNTRRVFAADTYVIKNDGATLTIKNGTIERVGDVVGYAFNNAQGTLNITGTTIKGGLYTTGTSLVATNANISHFQSTRHAIYAFNCNVTLNGGTYHNDNSGNATIMAAGSSVVTIKDGTFSIKDGRQELGWTSCLTDTQNTASITVEGGTFNGGFRVQTGATMTIEGGSFNDCYGSSYNIYGTAVVKGGTFTDANAINFAKNNLAEGYVASDNGNGTFTVLKGVSKIGDTYYATLQEAIDAVQDGTTTINILADITGDVTILQQEGINIVIDGKKNDTENYTFNGTINIYGNARHTGEETLTIQNVNFYTEDNARYFIEANEIGQIPGTNNFKQYAHNVTVENCNFATSAENTNNEVVGMRFRQAYNINVKGGIFTNLHSVMWATGGSKITVDGINAIACKEGGISAGTTTPVSVKNSIIEGAKYGVRADGSGAYSLTVEHSTLEAEVPVIVRNTTGGYNLTVKEDAILTAADGKPQVVVTADSDNKPYVVPTSNVNVTLYNNVTSTFGLTAKIGNAFYATLQNAVDNANDNDEIVLVSDVTEDVTITQKADLDLIINGDGKKFTGVMTVFGDARQNEADTLKIQNINFIAKNGATSCIVSPDRTAQNPARYSYSHNVTVDNCTFTDPDDNVNCAAIRHEDGGDKNWTVTKCTVDNTMHSLLQVNNVEGKLTLTNCNVNSKNGVNLNSCTNVEMTGCNFDVQGYALRSGVSSGGNLGVAKTYVLENNTLMSACDDGDAVIMFRASSVDANFSMTENVVSGATHISGHTADTKITADANYWDGEANPISEPQILVNSYYSDEELQNLVLNHHGNDFIGYTGEDAIWGEVWGNAFESFVIKAIDANGNVMGTASLKEESGYIDGDVEVTWSLYFDVEEYTGSSWEMNWTTRPTVANMPVRVELHVDGVKVGEGPVQLNDPDDLNKMTVAKITNDENGYIEKFYTSFDAAYKAATTGDVFELLETAVITNTKNWINYSTKQITVKANFGETAFRVQSGNSTVWFGKMTIESNDYCIIVGASDGSIGAYVDIYGGTYKGATTAISVTKGDVKILGGTFQVEPYEGSYEYTINCIDANYINGTAEVSINGGKFYNFNPQNNAAEGPGTNFLTAKYAAYEDADNYWNVVEAEAMIVDNGKTQYYVTLQDAVSAATDGQTVTLCKNINESVNISKLEKNITIDGNDYGTTRQMKGLSLGSDNNKLDAGVVTVKNIKFVGSGLSVNELANVTIQDNTFTNITEGNAITVICDKLTENVNVNGNIISNVEVGTGIRIRNAKSATVTGNKVSETFNNAILLEGVTLGDIAVTNNVLSNWGKDVEEKGRAIRIVKGENTNATITGNAMLHDNAPEQFVKISGNTENVNVDENYWSGKNPFAEELFTDDGNNNAYPNSYYAKYDAETNELSELVTIAYVAKIDKVQYLTFEAALNAVQDGQTITVLNVEGSEINKEIEFTKDIEFTITGEAPNYALPIVTFQNATVNIKDAKILIPELDARQNATINVIDSEVDDAGGNSIAKSYYNGALNISGDSKVYMMQVTTMGYINISGNAKLYATWQTNVYGNGLVTIKDNATFNTAALHLTGQDYSERDNTDADRVGKPAEIVVDGANFTVGNVQASNGADYSYNSSKGINVGTVDGKSAILNIMNGGNVNIYMANGETANIGAGGTVNVAASTLKTICRSAEGEVTLANNGTMNVTGEASINIMKLTDDSVINFTDVTIADAYIGGRVNAFGTNNFSGETNVTGILSLGYETDPSEQVVVNITGNFNGSNVIVSTNNGVDNLLNVGTINGERTTAYFGQLGAFADVNIVNADVTYGYTFIRNDFNVTNSTMEIKGGVNTYFAGNAKVVLDKTTWNLPGYANIGSYGDYNYGNADITLKNGSSMTATNLGIQVNGEKVVKLTLKDISTLTATNLSNQGEIVLANVQAKVTSNELTGTNNVPTTTVADHKVVYENGAYVVTAKQYVAKIGDEQFESLQEAFDAAENGATIELFNDNVAVIPMNASLYGKKVTITGTAIVDWAGWLFVGRGGEGDAELTFIEAKLTSNGVSEGLNVSCAKRNDATVYNGKVTIINSTINLPEFVNRNIVVVENSTINTTHVTSGGRPASETTNEEVATAEFTLTNSKLNAVGNITNGYEGIGIMNVDANSNVNVDELTVTATGTLNSAGNITGAIVKAEEGTIQLTGGIYTTEPQDGWCAENYGAFPYDENSWVVRMVYGTQEFTLTAGWNWMSSYISEFDKSVGLSMLVNALGDNGIQIKNNLGAYTYGGSYYGWSGNLTATSVKEMYKVNVTADVTFEFEGGFVNYDELEIPLYPGWNYIGYPVDVTTNIADALIISGGANFMDVIKSQNGTSTYAGEDTGWLSSDFFTLIPGEGYMYQNTSGVIKTLKYSTKVTTTTSNNRNRNHWTVDATQYPSNMTMIATVDVEGGDYEVAAFVNGEVRGSARPIYVEELDAHILILTISGNDVEEMTFMYYDIATGEEVELSNRINYSNDAIVGSIAEPYILTRGTTGIGEASMSGISIYPNPTTTGTEINLQATCDRVEVYNALGVKVAEYQNVDSIDALETAGIYVIRITNDGNVQNCRLVVK